MRRAFLSVLLLVLMGSPGFAQGVREPVDTLRVRVADLDEMALRAEADGFAERMEGLQSEIDADEEARSEEADAEAKKKIQGTIDGKNKKLSAMATRLQIVVTAMKKKGVADLTNHQILLTKTLGLKLENVSVDAAVGLFDEWVTKGKSWLTDEVPRLAVNTVLFLLILFAFKIFASIAGRVVDRALRVSKLEVSDLLEDFFVNIATKAIFFIGLVMALQVIGVPVGPLLAGIGILGFVVGFALQNTLANFAAGIMILLYRPYDIGNYVTAGGVSGTVRAMSLVSTTLSTGDNQTVVVPNGKIWGDVITNVTANPTRRVNIELGIGYEDDIDHAEAVLMDVVTSHPLVLKDPAPGIYLHNLGDCSVDFLVRPWAKTSDYWTVHCDLTKAIKQRFDKEGISIPYPRRDIRVVSGSLAESKES